MSTPSGKASIVIHLLTTYAVAMKYYFAHDKCLYIYLFFFYQSNGVWPIHLSELRSMALALPGLRRRPWAVNPLFSQEGFPIYMAADI